MKLAGKKAVVVLTEDGRQVLRLAQMSFPDANLLVVVHETEDLGIWIRVDRSGEEHCFLLRWEYVLGVDVLNENAGNLLGLKR